MQTLTVLNVLMLVCKKSVQQNNGGLRVYHISCLSVFIFQQKISLVVTLLRFFQVAEFIDERPEEVKRMEEFRTNNKWKLLGGKFGVVVVLTLANYCVVQYSKIQQVLVPKNLHSNIRYVEDRKQWVTQRWRGLRFYSVFIPHLNTYIFLCASQKKRAFKRDLTKRGGVVWKRCSPGKGQHGKLHVESDRRK